MKQWEQIQLGEFMPPRSEGIDPRAYPSETFDLYSIPAYDAGRPERLSGIEIGSAKQVVEPGDVLLSRIVPHIRRAWVVSRSNGHRLIGSGEWIVFRSPRVQPDYLRHIFLGDRFHAEFMRTVAGVGGSLMRARPSGVALIRIPLPPPAEQRRIAAILDQADALRAKRRDSIARVESLQQAIFLEMFGDPVTNPKKWPDPRLGGVLSFQQYGPRFYNESYSEDGIRIVRITDLDDLGVLNFAAMPRMDVSEEDRAKYSLKPNDLIFARSGATVGKVALIEADDPACIAGAYFITMRFVDRVHPVYARALLMMPSVRAIVAKRSRQAAQQNFSGPGLRSLPMPLPRRAAQEQFARRISKLRLLGAACQTSEADLNSLFSSLQHRAFRGEL